MWASQHSLMVYLKEERLLTENQPGTTRDSIYIDYQYGDQDLILIDTAGIRRKKEGRRDH